MLRVLAWYELIVGLIGLLFIVGLGVKSSLAYGAVYLAEVALFFSLYTIAGWLLFKDRPWGYYLSTFVQGVQVFQTSIGTFLFRIVAGPHIVILYLNGGINFSAGAHVTFIASPSLGDGRFVIGLNLVPVILLVWLFRASRRIPQTITSVTENILAPNKALERTRE